MIDMLIGEGRDGDHGGSELPIKGAVQHLVDYGLAKDTQEAFNKLGVTLMIGQDDTVYVPGLTPAGFQLATVPPSRPSPPPRWAGRIHRRDGA